MQLKMLRTQVTFQLRLQDHDNILGFDMSTDFESRFEGWASQIKAAISSKSKKLDALKKEHSARFRRNPFPDNPRAEALADCPLHEAIQTLEEWKGNRPLSTFKWTPVNSKGIEVLGLRDYVFST